MSREILNADGMRGARTSLQVWGKRGLVRSLLAGPIMAVFGGLNPAALADPVDAGAGAPSTTPPAAPSADAPNIAPQVNGAPGAATNQSGTTSLAEVVVTATKRSQSARSIPSTISVLTGQELENQGARTLSDFIDQAPGVNMQADIPGAQVQKIAVRGVGPDDLTNQTVGIVLGDTPVNDPYGSNTLVDPDPWDMSRIEVLQGPQGSLFGASSLAGLIRYVPNSPVLGEWEGKAMGQWVSIKNGAAEPTYGAMINVPLGSTLAFRAAGVVQHDPGYIDFDTPGNVVSNGNDVHRWSGRASLLWQPLQRLTVSAWYMDQQSHTDEPGFVTNLNGDLSRNDAPAPSPSHNGFSLGTVDLRYAFDWATLVSLSSSQHKIRQVDAEGTYSLSEQLAQSGVSLLRALQDVHANGFVQEVRLVSPDGGPWTWLAGAFYSTHHESLFDDIFVPHTAVVSGLLSLLPPTGLTTVDGVSIGNEKASPLNAGERALFGEVTRAIGPVKITLGGRLFRTTVGGEVTTATIESSPSTYAPNVVGKGFSPKLAATWNATNNVMLYALASRGFEFGGINILPAPSASVPTVFRSSTLWNYETGIRTDWFNRTLRFDLTAFYVDWKNPQVDETVQNIISEAFVNNVGAVKSRGFESTLRYIFPVKGLSANVNAAYTEARTSVPYVNSEGTVTASGTQMPNTPALQTSASLNYSRAFFTAWHENAELIYTHTNTSWSDIEHDNRIDARNVFNFNFELSRTDLAVSPKIGFAVKNLTDQRKVVAINPGAYTSQEGFPVSYTTPRTILLTLSLDY